VSANSDQERQRREREEKHKHTVSAVRRCLNFSQPLSLFRTHTLGCALSLRGHQVNDTAVDLNAGNDVLLLQDVNEGGSAGGLLVDGLVEQDDTRDVGRQGIVGGEEQLAVGATVLLGVLTSNVLKWKGVIQLCDQRGQYFSSTHSKTLSAGGGRLISGQDALAWCDDCVGNALELLLQFLWVVVEIGSHFAS
jgi:hypothetical protein